MWSGAAAVSGALLSSVALAGCASPDDIHSAEDLASYMEDRAGLSCGDGAAEDVSGAKFLTCFSRIHASQVRLEYFDDSEIGDQAEALLASRWVTRRGARWIVATTDESGESQSILDQTP